MAEENGTAYGKLSRDGEAEKYAHEKHLREIEDDIAKHFGTALADEEKKTLTLCRVLRNKLLHSDFYAMREKLRQSDTEPGNQAPAAS